MKQHHRTAIGAGFGLLAVAGVAASGAFACTKSGSLTNGTNVASTAKPGESVTVTSTAFPTPGVGVNGAITFNWVVLAHSTGTITTLGHLATISGPTTEPQTQSSGAVVSYAADTSTLSVTFKVPDDARPLPTDQAYFVQATQLGGPHPLNAALKVIVPGTYIPDLGSREAGEQPVVVDGGKADFKAADVGENRSNVPSVAGALPNEAIAAAERKAAPPVEQSGPSAPQIAELGGAPGVPTASPVGNDDPTQPLMAEPREAQLWTGLKTSVAPTSLLDGPQSAPSSSSSPAGVILLSMGVLALAGTGATVGQRRLALVKAARR